MWPPNSVWSSINTRLTIPINHWNCILGRKYAYFYLGCFGFWVFIENSTSSVRKTKQNRTISVKNKLKCAISWQTPSDPLETTNQEVLGKKKNQGQTHFEKHFFVFLVTAVWCKSLTFVSFSMSSQRMETLTLSLIFPPTSSLSASILTENQGTFSGWSLIIRNLVSSQAKQLHVEESRSARPVL